MPEELFWETMNPARLQALYTAAFPPRERAAAPKPAPEGIGLGQYLRGEF